MTRILLAGAAALALISGPALAQTSTTESTTTIQSTVTPTAPNVNSTYQSTKSKTYRPDGSETVQSKTFSESAGGGARETTRSRTFAPDGSEITSTDKERTVTPGVGETTTRSTTTTTDR